MKLNILTWNINFIHDNWNKRILEINKILEKETKENDIVALQEATLPFSNALSDVYKFLNNTNLTYFQQTVLERNKLYNFFYDMFPSYKKYIRSMLEYFMNILLYFSSWIYSYFGEYLKKIFFNHPYLSLLFLVLCPIVFIGAWFFFGMITIINKKIQTVTKSKYVGNRMLIQYNTFLYNSKNVIFINVHLSPGINRKDQRLKEVKDIVEIAKDYDVSIIAGDFNDTPNSNIYTFLENNNYRSAVKEYTGNDLNTFPSKNPKKCIDYVWIKGNSVRVEKASLFGTKEATDHKGIKITLDI